MAQQNEPMVELSTSRESLPVKLTHEEREERLSQAFAQIKRSGAARANEAGLKFKAKEATEEADSADMEAKRLMGIVEAGAEYRSVECVEVYDETTQTVRRVRTDTNEVLGTRQPNDLDKERIAVKRQRTLPGMGDAEKRNAGRGKKNSEEVTGTMH